MTLLEVLERFPTQSACITFLEKLRWGDSPKCPRCNSESVARKKENRLVGRWNCYNCRSSFNVLVGTLFQRTKVDLRRWFGAIILIMNAKNGISSYQLARDLGLNVKTAWYMAQRIRAEMKAQEDSEGLLQGVVEADEAFVGATPAKKFARKNKGKRGMGTKKMAYLGAIERGGRVVVRLAGEPFSPRGKGLAAEVQDFVRSSVIHDKTQLITDSFGGYKALRSDMPHHVVANKREVVEDIQIHTNRIESFWNWVKRPWYGTHHWYSRRYAPLYIAEACFKYNNRKDTDIFGNFLQRSLPIQV